MSEKVKEKARELFMEYHDFDLLNMAPGLDKAMSEGKFVECVSKLMESKNESKR